MPGVDKGCYAPGDGNTHYVACECREDHFKKLEEENAKLRAALEKLSKGNRSPGVLKIAQEALKCST